ncbi:hypothetical protein CV133_gene30 [Chlorobiaceae phage CV-1-33]|nr:hypothetical protein [Chlorobiaceae bacterium]QOE32037.1 hypothetical protein CV133_gene30 [Chlorobiaceae phage CV-1-33]
MENIKKKDKIIGGNMKNNDQEEYREDEIGRSLGELNGHCPGDCAKPVIRNLSEMGGFFLLPTPLS